MSKKDGIRERRQEKIRQLLEQQERQAKLWQQQERKQEQQVMPAKVRPVKEKQNPRYEEQSFLPVPYHMDTGGGDELDPEKLWKTNPHPWLGWESGDGKNGRHGGDIASIYESINEGGGRRPFFRSELKWKVIIAALLFAAIWGVFHNESPLAQKGQTIVKNALTDEMDFTAVATWYKETFAGAPSFIPIFNHNTKEAESANGSVELPVVSPLPSGAIVRTFAELLNGVELAGTSKEEVSAIETGRVLVVSEAENGSGFTVVIEHANGRDSVYGKLGAANVKQNDWVEAGDGIGTLKETASEEPSLLYFAIRQNNQYVDPVGVIPID
ncbi:peptidoglycan DD-metalloendopeptidase family protein [Paenibacillus sp. JDR-2]|uniref:peptidoglycan DD-metalloendopeptidase family protein n=1 Tax=Paenibacillus sp. (strain JDR-2) TaxID=324057 RepID=UPI0001666B50|nr:peptidoglycan DD-metalloendopeptidase family protein [Paenibacillus sp. JDR-2]ACT03037.1 Peptidase M23 [Paenibacillus sp. JDR-2]